MYFFIIYALFAAILYFVFLYTMERKIFLLFFLEWGIVIKSQILKHTGLLVRQIVKIEYTRTYSCILSRGTLYTAKIHLNKKRKKYNIRFQTKKKKRVFHFSV